MKTVNEGLKRVIHTRALILSVLLQFLFMTAGLLQQALAAPGDLNTSFGTDGRVTTDFGSSDDQVRSVAIQSDGKIVAAGFAGSDFALARYNADGTLDTTFGTGGKVTTDFASGNDRAHSVAIQSDGKIVAAGFAGSDFALARYNADGTLDTTFGTGGKVTTDFASGNDRAHSVAIQTDGKIVAAGFAATPSTGDHFEFALVRYNTDGSLDTSFGTGGKVVTVFGPSPEVCAPSFYIFDAEANSIAIQTDGKIVAGGQIRETGCGLDATNNYFVVARFNPNGSLDTTFGGDGRVDPFVDYGGIPVEFRAAAHSVAIQTDGKIVAAGVAPDDTLASDHDFALARLNPDGSFDTSFGTGGKVTTDFALGYEGADRAYSVVIQTDGKIVAAGFASPCPLEGGDCISAFEFALARYNPNGSLDTSFGTGGKVATDFASSVDQAHAVAIQADGKIVAAGFAYNPSGNSDFALARYWNVSVYSYPGPNFFKSPISGPPTVNAAKAGSAIPVKFTLTDTDGNYVTDVSAISDITYYSVLCSDFGSGATNEITATATGGSVLKYDSTTNQFIYNWKTPGTPGCYVLEVELSDDNVFKAHFQLK